MEDPLPATELSALVFRSNRYTGELRQYTVHGVGERPEPITEVPVLWWHGDFILLRPIEPLQTNGAEVLMVLHELLIQLRRYRWYSCAS
jgi:hypothetical protein